MKHETEQEAFWRGEFGTDYAERNRGPQWVASSTALFARVFQNLQPPKSVLELGANIGLNLRAIHTLLPHARLAALEINAAAATELRSTQLDLEVFEVSLLDFEPSHTWDFVFTKGVLIHLSPDSLARAYETLHRASGRYLCICEYYSPTPEQRAYRGHAGKLYKRDFAGELLDLYSDLELIDYGFVYHRDPLFPQDDLNWFLMRKRA